ncbi:LysE family translocator [Pseudomonas sp.]|uniref:LysE family translocator n=1 Tax=Pseudomonas sp. TaxID=306 RepID=UPI00289E87B8|nr:LysE family translocator [Pseudomonas sp.]
MTLHVWFVFCVAYLVTTLSPGPNVLLVIRNTLRYGARGTLATLAGNLTAQLFVIILVALGIGALVAAMPMAFLAMKLIGAAYLIYLGFVQLLKRQPGSSTVTPASAPVSRRPRFLAKRCWYQSAIRKRLSSFPLSCRNSSSRDGHWLYSSPRCT